MEHLGFPASPPCAQSPLEVRPCRPCPRSPGNCVTMTGAQPDSPECPRLLSCRSTSFCFKDDLMPQDGKETCSHLFTYTSVIQTMFSLCITWNTNTIPCRSVLICREGMALSEYGAFIPWTYFPRDVRLCNPAKLRVWLPLEEPDNFAAVFKLYHPPWAFVLAVCRWIDCQVAQ